MCIRYDDWLTIIDNTIYTMSQRQYYSYRAPKLQAKRLVTLNQLVIAAKYQHLEDQDRIWLQSIYNKLSGCSTCQFKRYANRATDIVLKYPQLVQIFHLKQSKPVLFKYPTVSQPIVQKVSSKVSIKFVKLSYDRKPCFDCVGKHIGTAYIKAIQCIQGYKEHAILGLADLQEAYQQCPAQCQRLKSLLLTCISKSIKDNQLFVPIQLLTRELDIAKSNVQLDDVAHDQNQTSQDLKLQLTQQDKAVLCQLDQLQTIQIKQLIQDMRVMLQTNPDSILWSGYMSRLAQLFMIHSKNISAMLRNRRLLFKELPQAALNSDYDCSDILQIINQCHQ